MSSPSKETEEPSSSTAPADEGPGVSGGEGSASQSSRPPAKRRFSSTVIEISDTESDDSDVCAVNSYQASADEVKRIRGEDYSSSSSSSEYSSDSESPWEDDSILVEDKKAISDIKAVKMQLNPRANRMDDPILNPKIKSQEVLQKLTTNWKELKDLTTDNIQLTCEPFRICLLNDFLANPEMINNIVDDMNTLDWSRKKMDLYEFHQTADLASLTWQRSIRGIYELLKTDVMTWVSQATGLQLRSVSASCSLYGPGDHLLAHDDRLSDRRVAFILYLAPWRAPHRPPQSLQNGSGDHPPVVEVEDEEWCGWSRSMGGSLQLFNCDAAGEPKDVVRSIYPRNNMLAFFQIGKESYHQVEEVLSLELPRLSINGWFHGPPPPAPEPPSPPPLPPPTPNDLFPPRRPHTEVVLMSHWLEPTYMSPRSRMQVQGQMETESEVCLQDFFLPARCEDLLEALDSPDVPWESPGPANLRHYERVPEQWATELDSGHPIKGLLDLLSSQTFVRMLEECTDLSIATYEKLELQRWTPGSYTVLPPREHYERPRLEAVCYLGAPAVTCGGGTSYLAPEECGAAPVLVTVPPAHNALSLVYCDGAAAAFTKYLSRVASSHQRFYILVCTYRE